VVQTELVKIFRHAADRAPVAAILAVFAVDLAIYSTVDSVLWLLCWTVLGAIVKGHVCAWNHHHQHVPTFESTLLNRALELVYGLQTGITSHTWVLHHVVGHHMDYLDQDRDESRWRARDGRVMGVVEYSLEVALTAYPRAYEVSKRFPRFRGPFLRMGALTLAVVVGLVGYRPIPALFVFVLPMIVSLVLTSWATHSHHSGKPTSDHLLASNNILHRGYNVLTGNLGYHTAHHVRPGLHWSKLPELHAKLEADIPDDCYLTPGFPWRLGQTTAPRRPGRPDDVPASGAGAGSARVDRAA
jgi:fatty acid desaturase